MVVEGLKRGSTAAELKEALTKQKIQEKWQQSQAHQRIAQRDKRRHLNDFLRFKATALKKQRNRIVQTELGALKTEYNNKKQKRLAPHYRFLAKVAKKRLLLKRKSYQRLARKILKKHKGKDPKRTEARVAEWKKTHPDAKPTTATTKDAAGKPQEKRKRNANRARPAKDRKGILQRKQAGEKKHLEKKLQQKKQKQQAKQQKVGEVPKK
jgi:hypothetical protein